MDGGRLPHPLGRWTTRSPGAYASAYPHAFTPKLNACNETQKLKSGGRAYSHGSPAR